MKYYVIVISDGAQAITVQENRENALSQYHTEMAYAYAANISRTCLVIDTNGTQIKIERFEAHTEDSELSE